MSKTKLLLGDNIQSLQKLPENSVDSIVSDPPYGLSFMGKKWDYDVPSVEFWKEVYRVLKPGGHVLSFGGTRTYHRMAVNIEDAGFEIRDQIMWLYGSGFPKSHNIGKAVDKLQGNDREYIGEQTNIARKNELMVNGRSDSAAGLYSGSKSSIPITKGQSPYEGWGTALKPANEPICVARKPLSEKTIAENVIKWGTGGINIDGCRVGTDTIKVNGGGRTHYDGRNNPGWNNPIESENEGRFPANIILDETAAELLDEQSKGSSKFFYQAKVSKKERNMGLDGFEEVDITDGSTRTNEETARTFGANRKNKTNSHPTVKPVSLMAYLCRLVTPPNGIVLDPFMGSGSTGIAARLEGFKFLGMELDKDYFKIAESRIQNFEEYRKFIK